MTTLSTPSMLPGTAKGPPPKGFFLCVKCQENRPTDELQVRSGQSNCGSCVTAYGSLQGRWGKDRALKTWWDARTAAEKVTWYRGEREVHQRGQKRSFDAITYEQSSSSEAFNEQGILDNWIPLNIYQRRTSNLMTPDHWISRCWENARSCLPSAWTPYRHRQKS